MLAVARKYQPGPCLAAPEGNTTRKLNFEAERFNSKETPVATQTPGLGKPRVLGVELPIQTPARRARAAQGDRMRADVLQASHEDVIAKYDLQGI